MDNPVATVVSVSNRTAVVRVAGSACPRCRAGKGCGAGIFGQSRSPVSISAAIPDGATVRAGDSVILTLGGQHLVRAALLAYGLPLAGVLAGALLSVALGSGDDATAIVLSATGLVVGAVAGRTLSRRDDCVNQLHPTIAGPAGSDRGVS